MRTAGSRPIAPGGHASVSAPAPMAAMPSAIRASTCSRNTNQAMSAVNTPSRLSSSPASDASRAASPVMSRTGAITPPATMAAPSHSQSAPRTRFTSGPLRSQQAVHAQAGARAQVQESGEEPGIGAVQEVLRRGNADTEQDGRAEGRGDAARAASGPAGANDPRRMR